MDTVSPMQGGNAAAPQPEQQQLPQLLLQEVQQRIDTSNQQLFAQVQQLLQQQSVAPAAVPVVAAAAHAVPQQATAPAPAAPPAKMNPPECFSGVRGQNVDDFCFGVTRYVEYNRLPPVSPQAVQCASSYLRGRAATWWRTYVSRFTPPVSVYAFCELLTQHFREANFEVHARDKLTRLQQKDTATGLRSYTDAFLNLVTALPELQEGDLVYHYTKGLQPRLKAELRARNPQTLEAAISLADTLDQAWKDAYFQPTGRRWTPRPPDPNGPAPMQLDALQLRGPASQQPQQKQTHHHPTTTTHKPYTPHTPHYGDRRPPPVCQLCRERGHFADKCPLLPPGTQLPKQKSGLT